MKFGLGLTTRGLFTNREAFLAVAKAADANGFDYLAVTDHLITPKVQVSKYPYTMSGAMVGMDDGHCMDQLSTLAFLAACTERVKLLTSVMVVPHRPAVLAAKMIATIDVLSKGRLILGIGAGWMREEIEALSGPGGAPFEARGKLTDETLAAFKELWTKDSPSFEGTLIKFKDVVFLPKPIQKPHPPIWIGGESKAALRRTIQHADVWYPGNNSQTQPLDTPQRLGEGIAHVKRACQAAGRDPSTLGAGLLVQNFFEWGDHRVNDGSARRMFTGTSEQMAEDGRALDKIGCGYATLRLGGTSAAEAVERIERFGREVIQMH
jgi:probable F420-dependent oxidoreductase